MAVADAHLYSPATIDPPLTGPLRIPPCHRLDGVVPGARRASDTTAGGRGTPDWRPTSDGAGIGGVPAAAGGGIRDESRTVFTWSTHRPTRGLFPRPAPGRFVTLRLPVDRGGPPLIRSYSLSGPPAADRYRISVKREPGGGGPVPARAGTGRDTLAVAAPRGAFLLTPRSGTVVSLSAGVGVTPGAGHAARSRRRRLAPAGVVDPGCAQQRRASVRRRDRRPAPRAPGCSAPVSYSRRDRRHRPRRRRLRRRGTDRDGRHPRLDVPEDADFYLCGPPAFMDDLTAGLAAWGFPATDPHRYLRPRPRAGTGRVERGAHRDRAPHPPSG